MRCRHIDLVVLTPASRPDNWVRILDNLRCNDLEWVPIVSDWDRYDDFPGPGEEPAGFVDQVFYEPEPGEDPCHAKLSHYLGSGVINPDAWYLTLCDDSLYAKGFFDRIRDAIAMHEEIRPDAAAVICTALRGHHTPPAGRHGTETLWAAPQNMRFGHVTLDQLILKGSAIINDNLRYGRYDNCADGVFAEALFALYEPQGRILYVPEACVLFNALEPGRWDHLPPVEGVTTP